MRLSIVSLLLIAAHVRAADEPIYFIPPDELVPDRVSTMDGGEVADWGHGSIDVPSAWKVTKGKGVVVAILDTGCDFDHRDLKEQIVGSKDFTGSRSGASDVNGHGSFCAGVVAAAENSTGVVGVAPEAKLLIVKVLGDKGSGSSSGIAAGIDYAADQGAHVISMSLGSTQRDPFTCAAIDRAVARGVIVCVAAGNSGPRENTVGWPGSCPDAVCVAAVDESLHAAGFSSRGQRLDVSAPGVAIRSCYPGDRFATMSGTSMATPYVAGCAALYVAAVKAKGGKVDPKEFASLIASTARDLAPPGRDTATGYGLIQPAKLVGDPPVVDPDPPVPVPPGGGLELVLPGATLGGKKIKRIVFEFEDAAPARADPVKPAPPPVYTPANPAAAPRAAAQPRGFPPAQPGFRWEVYPDGRWGLVQDGVKACPDGNCPLTPKR